MLHLAEETLLYPYSLYTTVDENVVPAGWGKKINYFQVIWERYQRESHPCSTREYEPKEKIRHDDLAKAP